MACVPAPACKSALAEATRRWPMRNRASDGICGDASHQARKSDHNLGNAYDLTHDPKAGVDCNELALLVVNDPRISYVIWNRRIYNPSVSSEWRGYYGANPHDKHMHVSIKATARNDESPWFKRPTKPKPAPVEDDMICFPTFAKTDPAFLGRLPFYELRPVDADTFQVVSFNGAPLLRHDGDTPSGFWFLQQEKATGKALGIGERGGKVFVGCANGGTYQVSP